MSIDFNALTVLTGSLAQYYVGMKSFGLSHNDVQIEDDSNKESRGNYISEWVEFYVPLDTY